MRFDLSPLPTRVPWDSVQDNAEEEELRLRFHEGVGLGHCEPWLARGTGSSARPAGVVRRRRGSIESLGYRRKEAPGRSCLPSWVRRYHTARSSGGGMAF